MSLMPEIDLVQIGAPQDSYPSEAMSSPYSTQGDIWGPRQFIPVSMKSTAMNLSSPSKMLPLPSQPSFQPWAQPNSPGVTYSAPEASYHGSYSDVEMQDFTSNNHKGQQIGEDFSPDMCRRERVGDSLRNWYTDNDAPFVPRGVIPSVSEDIGFRFQRPQRSYNNCGQGLYPNQYPPLDTVETASIAPSWGISDSGYGSRRDCEDASVFSGEVAHAMDKSFGSISSFSDGNREDCDIFPSQTLPSLITNVEPQRNIAGKKPMIICPGCQQKVKTRSELKKHEYRHNKPFKCDFTGCERTEGFSTSNDLERHKRSKHPSSIPNNRPLRRYRCLATQCKSKDKTWPRLDNFRSHLKRMHSIEGSVAEDYVARGATKDQDIECYDSPASETNTVSYANSLPIKATTFSDSPFNEYPQQTEETHTPLPVIKTSQDSLFRNWATTQTAASENTINQWSSVSDIAMEWANDAHTSPLESDSYTDPRKTSNLKHILNDIRNVADSDNGAISNKNHLQPIDRSIVSSSNVIESDGIEEDEKDPLKVMIEQLRAQGYEVTKGSPLSSSKQTLAPKANGESSEVPDRGKKQTKQVCKECEKFWGRPCEVKKHMKRHVKPYGCTFLGCQKSFGSKNDWKRHEVSQHSHPKNHQWRCDLNSNSHTCQRIFSEAQHLEDHLKDYCRDMPKDDLDCKVEACRIGANNSIRFWCGFCKVLINLKSKDVEEAKSERFNHIDDHFMGRGDSPKGHIKDWLPSNDNPKAWMKPQQFTRQSSGHDSSHTQVHLSRKRSATDDIEGKISKSRRSGWVVQQLWRRCCDCGVSSPHSRFKEGCDFCNNHLFCKDCEVGAF